MALRYQCNIGNDPKFCVNNIYGVNRAILIQSDSQRSGCRLDYNITPAGPDVKGGEAVYLLYYNIMDMTASRVFFRIVSKLLEWEEIGLTYLPKDRCIRCQVRQPTSHL